MWAVQLDCRPKKRPGICLLFGCCTSAPPLRTGFAEIVSRIDRWDGLNCLFLFADRWSRRSEPHPISRMRIACVPSMSAICANRVPPSHERLAGCRIEQVKPLLIELHMHGLIGAEPRLWRNADDNHGVAETHMNECQVAG